RRGVRIGRIVSCSIRAYPHVPLPMLLKTGSEIPSENRVRQPAIEVCDLVVPHSSRESRRARTEVATVQVTVVTEDAVGAELDDAIEENDQKNGRPSPDQPSRQTELSPVEPSNRAPCYGAKTQPSR